MESDAEYRAYERIVKNDRRQRVATFLLLIAVLTAVLASLIVVANNQRDLVADAQRDSRIRTDESRRYVTCLLILPLEARNVSGQRYCFDRSDLPGGRQPSEFTPLEVDQADAAVRGTSGGAQDR